jgi:hypothetical protein
VTTLHAQSNRGNKPPDAYKAHLDKLATDHTAFLQRRRRERLIQRLSWACVASIVALLVVAAWRDWS